MAKYKAYILDDLFPTYEREHAVLATADAEGIVTDPKLPEAELVSRIADADAVLVNRCHITRNVVFGLPKLKIISLYGIGTDGVDIPAATERKIPVANLPGFCAEDVSEVAIMLLLAASRKLLAQNSMVKSREVGWVQGPFKPIYRVAGKTLGLVGLGSIGRAVARKAQGLGMKVIVYDPYVSPQVAEQLGVGLVGLEELFRSADHVSLHVGVTPETTGMINAGLLRLLKPTSTLVNTSRGKIVNQDDLVTVLKEGWIGAAGLDVVREDPPSEETYASLISLPNVVITPHTAWYTEESQVVLQTDCARNVALVLGGSRPMTTVNKEIYG
jgi:D-3-phosphoglycerate dehydrogenase / 2-oxoglutarate reductase